METAIILKENHDIEYSSFLLHKNGITPIGQPTIEQWSECFSFVQKAEGAVHFWIGDLLNYKEERWGKMYEEAVKETGYTEQTLTDDKWIAKEVPFSLRNENLTRTHAHQIASLSEEEKIHWANEIAKAPIPVAKLKQLIKADHMLKAGKQTIEVKASLYGENIYFKSGEKSEARWDDYIILAEEYPTITRLSRFFHTDGLEFSLREYARVQDFPDSYKFVGAYSSIKSQIGNAVSPMMARFIGMELKGTTFIDLFAGCGGLSCGLEELGKKAVYANEVEPNYFQTYIFNHSQVNVETNDIHNIKIEEIPDADIVVGGPPCQGFSSAGLRLKEDPRNELYKEFLRIVDGKKPKEFLMENVPEIADIKEQIIEDFKQIGYTTTFQIVKGEDIGMKQRRHRAFFIGRYDENRANQ